MPFGRIFGAVFFLFASWLGVRLVGAETGASTIGGVLLVVLGLSLSAALLTQRSWARWAGLLGAIGMLLYGGLQVEARGDALDFACALGALITAILLLLRNTAEPTEQPASAPAGAGVLGWTTALAGLGLIAIAGHGFLVAGPEPERPALPAAVLNERIDWTDYGDGIERARAEGKPVLVTFETSWCGYCKKMDQTTWKHPSVVERLSDEVVAVKVNTEDGRSRNGYTGVQLAGQYQISGTPTQLLLDAQGRVLSRGGGYQTPRQFLGWLEAALGGQAGRVRVAGP